MKLTIQSTKRHPQLNTFEQAKSHRDAEKVRNAIKPDLLALSEAVAAKDQSRGIDHQQDKVGDVVVTDYGLSYSSVSPYSSYIRWSPVTTNIEAGRVVFNPEDGMLKSAEIELPDRTLTFKAEDNANVYTSTDGFGQVSKVREDLTTGTLTLL